MIKICYIIGQLVRHGTEKQLYELLRGINRKEYHPVVVSLSQNGYWGNEIRKLNIEVIEIYRRKNKEIRRLFKLIKLLRVIKPDIVHTYLFSANSYGRIAAIFSRIPIIVASERNLPKIGKDKSFVQLFIDKILALFSQGIICNTYRASDLLVNKYSFDKNKIYTVHNGINFIEFLNNLKVNNVKKNGKKVIGTVGRLHSQKNHKLFLRVAKIILENEGTAKIEFNIIGNGALLNELINYSKKLGIHNRVNFVGEKEDIQNELNCFDIFLMTSNYEGISNAIMEAMAMGLPVVSNDVGGNAELIIDGKTGFLCPSNDAKALAEKVIFLINNNYKAKLMGEYGRKRIKNEFNVEKMILQTEKIYVKLLDRNNVQKSEKKSP